MGLQSCGCHMVGSVLLSSENQNFTPSAARAENLELKKPIALLVIGPAEQQSALQYQVKLLLRVLPDGIAVFWWGWCPWLTLKEIENEINRTAHTKVKNALI